MMVDESPNERLHKLLLENLARVAQTHRHGRFNENEFTYRCCQQMHLRNLPEQLLKGTPEIYPAHKLCPEARL